MLIWVEEFRERFTFNIIITSLINVFFGSFHRGLGTNDHNKKYFEKINAHVFIFIVTAIYHALDEWRFSQKIINKFDGRVVRNTYPESLYNMIYRQYKFIISSYIRTDVGHVKNPNSCEKNQNIELLYQTGPCTD
jgi:hypothetical protein